MEITEAVLSDLKSSKNTIDKEIIIPSLELRKEYCSIIAITNLCKNSPKLTSYNNPAIRIWNNTLYFQCKGKKLETVYTAFFQEELVKQIFFGEELANTGQIICPLERINLRLGKKHDNCTFYEICETNFEIDLEMFEYAFKH